ncbi:MAG: hypothetical protein J6P58_06035, partial [Oscillospiraceae bacterium]|nr:hypothetical protein [Oscillospiraceae bacterium]
MGLRDRDSTDAYGRSNRSEKEGAKFRKYKKGYERYFEGYGVETTTTPSGKSVSVRVYRGTLYRQELTEAALRRNRILHSLMAI